jgi:hypothetical protein
MRRLFAVIWNGNSAPDSSFLWTAFWIISVEFLWKLSKVTAETTPLIRDEILLQASPTKS